MGKTLLVLSMLSLVILIIGTSLFPNSTLFWLASDNGNYQIIREVLVVLLFMQIITKPPRNVVLRFMAGIVAISVSAWAIESTYNYHMMFLDSLSIIGSALAIGITALERKSVPDNLL